MTHNNRGKNNVHNFLPKAGIDRSAEVDRILQALMNIKYNEKVVYYVGFLLNDRTMASTGNYRAPLSQSKQDVRLICDSAWYWYERGKCALLQRKIGENMYEYYALGSKPKTKGPQELEW